MQYKRKANRWVQAAQIIGATVVVFAFIILVAHVPLSSALATEGANLETQASAVDSIQGQEGLLDLRLAFWLHPTRTLATKLVGIYVAHNRPDDAIAALRHLPLAQNGLEIASIQFDSGQYDDALVTIGKLPDANRNPQVLVLKSKVLLEQGATAKAVATAKSAYGLAPSAEAAQVQYGLSLGVSQNISTLRNLVASVSSNGAGSTLQQSLAGKVSLAEALYAHGLLNSSKRVLQAFSDESTEKYLLLADIAIAAPSPTQTDLQAAAQYLKEAIALNPGNLLLHTQLQDVDRKLGDATGAHHETVLISQLRSGKV
jgi:tetratricopeptide (TPR) repeat protein